MEYVILGLDFKWQMAKQDSVKSRLIKVLRMTESDNPIKRFSINSLQTNVGNLVFFWY